MACFCKKLALLISTLAYSMINRLVTVWTMKSVARCFRFGVLQSSAVVHLPRLGTIQDVLCELVMKTHMHLVEVIIFSLFIMS